MSELLSLTDVAKRCNVTRRTVQRHANDTGIGRNVGGMRVLTPLEADRLAEIVAAAKPGRPRKKPQPA